MSRSLASLGLAALTLTAAGVLAASPALAATAPAPGTAACTAIVQTDATVVADQKTVDDDQAAVTAAVEALNANPTDGDLQTALTTARGALTDAKRALKFAQDQATSVLCTGTATSGTSTSTGQFDPRRARTTTPAPATSPAVVPHTVSQATSDSLVDALSCSSSNAELQRIDKQIVADRAAGQTSVAAEVNQRLNAKLASLNCTGDSAVTPKAAAQTAKDCGCDTVVTEPTTVTDAPVTTNVITSKTVNPTQSDGSVATTSGNEVTDVPAGSAATGIA